MKEEVKAQLKRVEMQIETEQQVYAAWKCFTDSDMKTAVINQSIGVVRGLEVAREALQFILDTSDNNQITMSFESEATDGPEVMEKLKRAAARENRGIGRI